MKAKTPVKPKPPGYAPSPPPEPVVPAVLEKCLAETLCIIVGAFAAYEYDGRGEELVRLLGEEFLALYHVAAWLGSGREPGELLADKVLIDLTGPVARLS